jgi:uncharacterized protein
LLPVLLGVGLALLLFLAGLVSGFLAGMTGIGTGILLLVIIPFSLHYLGVHPDELIRYTIANTIFATLCSSFLNNLTVIKRRRFYLYPTLWVGVSGLVTSALALHFVILRMHYPKEWFNTLVVSLLIYIVFRTVYKLRQPGHEEERMSKSRLALAGIAGGLVASFSGLGGGSVVIPMLNLWMKMDIKKAKSISFGMIFLTSLMLSTLYIFSSPQHPLPEASLGYIVGKLALPLSLGVIIASPLGVVASEKMPSRTVTIIFLSVVTVVIMRKLMEMMPMEG